MLLASMHKSRGFGSLGCHIMLEHSNLDREWAGSCQQSQDETSACQDETYIRSYIPVFNISELSKFLSRELDL